MFKLARKAIVLIRQKKELLEIEEVVRDESFDTIEQPPVVQVRKIMFVIPFMDRYSGGGTSALRLAMYLKSNGYQVVFGISGSQSSNKFIDNAKFNLKTFDLEVLEKDELIKSYADVIVATSWNTVYFVKRLTGYKMYFVQDYEPYFYTFGDRYLLAKKTYELGFHMVSLGRWNRDEIIKNSNKENLKIDVIDFPYEKSEYGNINRDYSGYSLKKKFKIAVYIKLGGKRIPNIIQIMMKNLQNKFAEDNKEIEIFFFGEEKYLKTICGENVGKLTKKELQALYESVDFGMVASMTNISLVPFEMIATGLPIIEFSDGVFEYFFDKESAILTSFSYQELYEKIISVIDNPNRLESMIKHAQSQIESLGWEKSAKQFIDILECIEKDKMYQKDGENV